MTTLTVKFLPLVESMNLKNNQPTKQKTPADLGTLEGVKVSEGTVKISPCSVARADRVTSGSDSGCLLFLLRHRKRKTG